MELTRELIENTYEFKLIVRSLKRKYPWIVGAVMDEELLNSYQYIMYIDLIINPEKLKEYFNAEFKDYFLYFWNQSDKSDFAIKHLKEKRPYIGGFLESILDSVKFNHAISDYIGDLRKNFNLPKEMKIPSDKTIVFGGYYIDKYFN